MAWSKLWVIAFRDLGRNRRRTILTLLAVALGLALLIFLNGFIAGVTEDALQNTIRLETGHVQLRTATYEEDKVSLQRQDLLANPTQLAAQASSLSGVKAAAPVLWAGALIDTRDESVNLQLIGIDTTSDIYAPFQQAMVAGAFLTPDDRNGILIGKRLADSLGLAVDRNVSLTVIDGDGTADDGVFTIRGLFSTGIPRYDDGAVFMPLSKAQAFARTGDRASAVIMLLQQQDQAEQVASALQSPGVTALTWRTLNQVFLETMSTAMSFYTILDAIVMLIVAVIIANTLLMAVFERIREMGILAALGMKGGQIMQMFLFEATILGLGGIIVGVILGSGAVAYLATVGLSLGDAAAAASNIALRSTIYARFVPGTFAILALWTLIITLLASLYPAWFAARLEPVTALHSL